MTLLLKGGITRLSELAIDADKDWAGHGIVNLGGIAAGMSRGHIPQHNGTVIETLPPGADSYVLTSEGPAQLATWAPGGMYLWRYFPVSFYLSLLASRYVADHQKAVNAPLGSPYGLSGVANPDWYRRLNPSLSATMAAAVFNPISVGNNPVLGAQGSLEVPVGGAVADDGGVLTDETTAAKSGYTLYESYSAGEDNQKAITTSAWEAQTFTPAVTQAVRFLWLKLYATATVIVTVSIRAVDGSGHPSGADLCLGTITDFFLASPGRMVRVAFASPALLSAGIQYAIVVRASAAGLNWRCDSAGATYPGGRREYSTNGGTTWSSDTGADSIFEDWGTPVPDMNIFPLSVAAGDAYYFGHARQFGTLVVDIGQAGAGSYSLAWEYSKGAGVWSACSDLIDGSDAFRNSWWQEVSHTPQADWAPDVVSGKNLYWLRARCSDVGAGYSQPKGNFARARISV